MFEVSTEWTAPRFAGALDKLVQGQEAEYNLALGLLERALREPNLGYETLLATVGNVRSPTMGAIQTRRENIVLVGHGPEAAQILAQYLYVQEREVQGAVGHPDAVNSFAAEWMRLSKATRLSEVPQGIYKLEKVQWPRAVPGVMRYASDKDLAGLTEWLFDFCNEAIPEDKTSRDDAQKIINSKIKEGLAFIWEHEGKPVSMACLARPAAGGVCVNSVYTPPSERRKGYASQLVAALSAHALSRAYRFCTLYTDLRNPTSNSIYSKIGYRRVADSLMIRWD